MQAPDFSSADTGEENVQNLAFSVTGQYVNIIEFIYAIEDDSELNFKIENYKMVPNEANLTATFNVTNVRVNVEKITTQEETEENSNTNENTQATTDTNNTTNTTVDANTNNTTNDTANTIINDL